MATATKLWASNLEISNYRAHSSVTVGMGFPVSHQEARNPQNKGRYSTSKILLLFEILKRDYTF